MSVYSQPELLRRSNIFTTYGLQPDIQALIASAGMTPDEIACGAAKLASVQTAETHKEQEEAHKRKATLAEKIAWEAAQCELANLAETVRTLFANHEPVMRLMTVTSTEATSDTDLLAQWRVALTSVAHLSPDEQMQLAQAGWPSARLATAHALVEGYAKAETDQRVAASAAQAARAMHKAALKDLEAWYLKARQTTRTVLHNNDPESLRNLNILLGLE